MSDEKKSRELNARKQINYLVQKAKTGNHQASEELLDRLKPLMYATIKRNLSVNGSSWEDLVQDASLSILEGIRDYDEKRGIPFLAYIKSKLKFDIYNLCRKERTLGSYMLTVKKGGQDPLDFVIDEAANPEEELINKERAAIIKEALMQLDPKHKELIHLLHIQKVTLKIAAKKMGISYKTAQRYKAKAKERLAGLLGE